MRRRSSIEAWATALFGGVLPLVFSTRCSTSTPPVAPTAPSAEPAVALPDRPDDLDESLLDKYGCYNKYTVCVNACTAEVVESGYLPPNVAEGQKVKIRAIGWESCRPKTMTCKSHNVQSINTRFPSPDDKPPAPAQVDPRLAAAKADLAPPSPTPPAAPLPVAPERQAVEDARTELEGVLPTKLQPAETQAIKDALSSLHNYLARFDKARQSFVTAAWGADAAKKTDGIAADDKISADVKQGAQKAGQHLRAANITSGLLAAELAAARSKAEQALESLDALESARASGQAFEAGESRREKYDADVAFSQASSAGTGGNADHLIATARMHHRAAGAHNKALFRVAKAREEIEHAFDVTKEYVDLLARVIAAPPPNVDMAQLRAVDERRVRAEQAVDEAIAVDVLAVQASEDAARVNMISVFGDCVLQVPAEDSLREVVVKVEFTRLEAALAGASASSGGGAGVPPPAPGTPPATTVVDNGVDQADSSRKAALVHVPIDHGKYYYDVGIVTAVVPEGGRSIATPTRPGVDGDRAIEIVQEAKIVTGAALNIYPWGHRRGTYSPWEGGWNRSRWGDLLSVQVAANPNPKELLSTLFIGGGVEPVTGVALSAGALLSKGDFLRGGYVEGMSPPSNRDDYVVSKYMLRPYFGVTLGFELVHTTAARLQPKSQTGSTRESGN